MSGATLARRLLHAIGALTAPTTAVQTAVPAATLGPLHRYDSPSLLSFLGTLGMFMRTGGVSVARLGWHSASRVSAPCPACSPSTSGAG